MAEDMFYNSLEQDMTFAGINFFDIDRKKKRHKKSINLKGEFDIVLINGTTLAIIEAKYRVRPKDISKLIEKQVPDFRLLFPEYNNHKIILGIGGMSFEDNSEQFALKNGIGIIKIVGDKVEFHTENVKEY